ncbi:MAG: response regulator [Gemmatimonadaceae bacterium]|nr:response regulator [Gemmatimonadaceae bacterium]
MSTPALTPAGAKPAPARPLLAAMLAGAFTAVTLMALGAIWVLSVGKIANRVAVDRASAALTAAARTMSTAGIAPDARHTLAILDAVLPEAIAREVAAIRGDTMTIVATSIALSPAGDSAAASRLGQSFRIPAEVAEDWRAGSIGTATLPTGARGREAVSIWEPVRGAAGSVTGAVGALVPASTMTAASRAEFKDEMLASAAVTLALSLLAGIGRYHAERSRALSEAEMRAAKEAAEETARARGEFLANMSHEVRTPLHGVLGMTEAMLAAPHTEADRRSIEVINRSASNLLGILNDILDYSKLEAGRVELVNAPFDPRALVDDAIDLFAVRADEKDIDLAITETATFGLWPVGDATRIRQVLLNLIGNAVKFTEKGSIRIALSTIAIGRKAAIVRFAVSDTGIGIAPDKQERVFEQFAQAEGTTARRFGGTGLGLTISRHLVTLMGGSISVSSVPGEGATFVVELSLPAVPARAEPGRMPAAGTHVLVCTHRDATRAAIADMCAKERLIVDGCATPGDAAAVLRKRSYAVVISEAAETDGPHQLSGLGAPLVVLTTVARPLNNSALAAMGAAAQLRRPVRHDHMLELLSAVAAGQLGMQAPPVSPASFKATAWRVTEAAAVPAHAAEDGRTTPSGSTAAEAPRVLVVDDVELNLMVAKAMLTAVGVAARTAAGGEQAIEVLSHEPMDLVLMDCHMPGVDGYEATRRIRASDGPNRETPIVALSASAFPADRDRALASGMNDFATKPIELTTLSALLERWTQEVPT